jgi:hypothetical protein
VSRTPTSSYNRLWVSQGIIINARVHFPANILVEFSPSDSLVGIEYSHRKETLSYLFTSETDVAFMWDKDDSKPLSYFKDILPRVRIQSLLVTRGEQFRKDHF